VATQRPPSGGSGEPPQTPSVDEQAAEEAGQDSEMPVETATVTITPPPSPIIEPTITVEVALSDQATGELPREEPIEEVQEVAEEPVTTTQDTSLTIFQPLIIILAIVLITLGFVTLYLRRQLKR
jgi:hypothetical protein